MDFHQKLADRSVVPLKSDFFNMYTAYREKRYGSNTEEMLNILKTQLTDLDDTDYVYQEHTETEPFILALITPLMKRVHNMVLNL